MTAGLPSRAAAIRRSYLEIGGPSAHGHEAFRPVLGASVTSSGPRPKRAETRWRRAAGASPGAPLASMMPRMMARAWRRSSRASGSRAGIAPSAASSSIFRILVLLADQRLECGERHSPVRLVRAAEPGDCSEAALVDGVAGHADPEEGADQCLRQPALGHGGAELLGAALDQRLVQLAPWRLARGLGRLGVDAEGGLQRRRAVDGVEGILRQPLDAAAVRLEAVDDLLRQRRCAARSGLPASLGRRVARTRSAAASTQASHGLRGPKNS